MSVELEEPLVQEEQEQAALASGIHGELAVALSSYIFNFVRPRKLGRVFDGRTSFAIDPNAPRKTKEPDVSFVTIERLPHSKDEVLTVVPDLAIEIVTNTNEWEGVIVSIEFYLQVGVRLVWLVDAITQNVLVFTPETGLTEQEPLWGNDELDGAPVLPGFKLKVSEIFDTVLP
jgi:Uma2 family endonuclease